MISRISFNLFISFIFDIKFNMNSFTILSMSFDSILDVFSIWFAVYSIWLGEPHMDCTCCLVKVEDSRPLSSCPLLLVRCVCPRTLFWLRFFDHHLSFSVLQMASSRDLYNDSSDVPLSYSSTAEDDGDTETNSGGRIVDLSGQYWTEISDTFFFGAGARFSPELVTELNLSNNRFSSIPSVIFKLSGLQVLDFSNNSLSSIPTEIGNLRSLKAFSARNNAISSIPKTFQNLSQIQEINVAGNNLTEFPQEFLALNFLKTLYMGANKLTSIPSQIDRLQR